MTKNEALENLKKVTLGVMKEKHYICLNSDSYVIRAKTLAYEAGCSVMEVADAMGEVIEANKRVRLEKR